MKRDSLSCWALAAALAAALLCVDASAAAAPPIDTPTSAALLKEADQIRLSNYPRFLDLLKQLHQQEGRLTSAQRWHLKYLDTLQSRLAGDITKAIPALQDIINHSGDPSLSARATAQLIQADFLAHRYEEAYVLANSLIANLPEISDPLARRTALSQVIQMMNSVGQHDLALKYARQIKTSFPSGEGQCEGNLSETQTLLYAGKLKSSSPAFQKTIDSCLAVKQVISANTMRLSLAGQLTDEGHADQAVTLLQKIAPSIRRAKYQIHVAALHVLLADAYTRLGDDTNARKSALDALAANSSNSVRWVAQYANKDLYLVEKKMGNDAAALSYYEKYVAQDKASTDETKTRALAYQMVKQEVLDKKMRVDALSKQNKILQLRQTLADKATETGRLYIVLLLVVIVFIVLLMYRVKHSQLRFRQMARTDGLTGAFNRQHFLDEARRTLQRLSKADVDACLVLLDLDYFKQVNDTHGHAAGDNVLTRTVAICRQELRASDVFGRLGGEEFGILMPSSSCEQGIEIATRIRRAMAATPIELVSGATVTVSASFGLACSRVSGYDLHQLLSVADAAQYRAKRAGRNQLAVGSADDVPNAAVVDTSDTACA